MRAVAARRVVALAVLLGAWVPALASIVVAWAFDLPLEPVPGAFLSVSPPGVQSRFDDIGVTVALIYGALSAVLIARRPHPVAVITAVHAVGSGVAALGVQWGLLGEQVPDLPFWGLLLHAAGWGYVPGTLGTTIIPLLLLPRPRSTAHRILIGTGIALAVVAFAPALTRQAPDGPPNPFAIPLPAWQEAAVPLYNGAATAAVVLSVVVAVLLAVRWATTPPEDRRRLGWLVVGHGFLTLSYGALVLPAGVAVPTWVWDFGMIAPVVGQIFYPSAVLVLVLGPRLRGVDTAVSRVLAWSILTVVAVAGYLILDGALAALLPWSREAIGVAAAALVAVALIPAHDPLQRRVDALVWDDQNDPEGLIRRLGERLGELESGAEGLAVLAAALRSASRLGGVGIRSLAPGGPSASAGMLVGDRIGFDLVAAAEPVGRLEVAARRGESVSARTRRQLAELAPLVAAILRLAQAGETLERARDSVLAVRHGERRAMRRDLHDGIGPALAGIGFGLAAVDRMLDSDPGEARLLLRRLADDLRSRVREVDSLVRAAREDTAVVDLAADLGELASDFSAAGARVEVGELEADAVAPSLRRTVYLVAAEAVHNAVRHAGADRIDITLRRRGDEVELVVSDDGRGLPGVPTPGIGLVTMRERAAEIGARLDLDASAGGGLAVRLRLAPTPSPATAPTPSEVLP